MKKVDQCIIFASSILLPVIISICILLRMRIIDYVIVTETWVEIIKVLLGVWGTLLGFIVTALSIILAIGNSPFLKLLNKTGHIKTIMLAYVVTSIMLFIATVFGILVVCLNTFSMKLLGITIFLIFSTFLSLMISLFFLFTIIFNSVGEDNE